MPNHINAIETSVGRGVWDPNLEFGVDRVEEEDWACWLWYRHREYLGALVDRQRVLQGVPKDKVTAAIVWREVRPRIVELDLRIVHYVPDRKRRQSWHHW